MQALIACTRGSRSRALLHDAHRCLSTTPAAPQQPTSSPLPWFVDSPEAATGIPPSLKQQTAASRRRAALAPLPSAIPEDSPIAGLHAALATSPFLERGGLLVTEPISTATGPPLPRNEPKGRRKRGRTYSGEGIPESGAGTNLWNWIVIAQVKTGTENRGTIESVMRVVRKTLLSTDPPLALPHNHKRRVGDGWSMLDAGDFAVHIVSKAAREKYFPEQRKWQTIYAHLIFYPQDSLPHMQALTDGHCVLDAQHSIDSTMCNKNH